MILVSKLPFLFDMLTRTAVNESFEFCSKITFVPIFSSELDYLNSRLIMSIATSRLVITTTQPSRVILQLLEFSPFAKYSFFNYAVFSNQFVKISNEVIVRTSVIANVKILSLNEIYSLAM